MLVAGPVCADAPQPAPSAKSRHDAQLEDLETARNDYVMRSKAFTPEAKRQALDLIAHMEAKAGDISDIDFLVGILKLTALADNGHDFMDDGEKAWLPPKRLPFRMIWFPDGTLVARAAPEQADLLGARVLSIEGMSPDELFSRLGVVVGGNQNYRTWDAMWLVGLGDVLHNLGLAKSADSLRMTFRLADGRTLARTIALVPPGSIPPGGHAFRLWSPAPLPGEAEKHWSVAADAAHAPLYLQDPDAPFRMLELPELDALYVQIRVNFDFEGHAIKPFVASVKQAIETKPPRNLIYDMRFNTGGDIMQTRDLIHEIAAQVPGRIYVMVGRFTFSAGIVSAAALKHDGGARVTIVGESLGDRLRWWSEGPNYHLVNSDLYLHPSTGLWDLEKGCKGEPDCYGDQFDANVGSLVPAIRAPLNAAAWLEDRDPGMEAVEADLAKNRSPNN